MVSKTIDKTHRQNVKQEVHVKVHIGDKKKKRVRKKRAAKKNTSEIKTEFGEPIKQTYNRDGIHPTQAYNPYAQSYNPVFIQSGNPQEETKANVLLDKVNNLVNDVKLEHIERRENALLSTVKKTRHNLDDEEGEMDHSTHHLARALDHEFVKSENDFKTPYRKGTYAQPESDSEDEMKITRTVKRRTAARSGGGGRAVEPECKGGTKDPNGGTPCVKNPVSGRWIKWNDKTYKTLVLNNTILPAPESNFYE